MGKHFETRHEATVDATPDQVWDAIATGPGISSWFVGHTTIDDTTVTSTMANGITLTGTITTADPPHHFAYRSDTAPDGRFIAYEYLVQGHDHSTTLIRSVTSGFLPGDDWTDEYEAMRYGTALFFATLTEMLQHFPGRTAPQQTTYSELRPGWQNEPHEPGTVYFTNPHTIGVRTDHGLVRYLRGIDGTLVTSTTHLR